MSLAFSYQSSRPLAQWLLLCAMMTIAMILIGAITRLTESGLSMVEWRATMDMLPPLSDSVWQSEFDKYKETPEFILKNSHMDLDDFKTIYFWEWFHRLWGRVLGLVFALPLAWFWLTGKIEKPLRGRMIGLLALGGLQGFIGWFMVKSGLIDEPRVSPYRLALHLSAAFLLLVLLWCQALLLHPGFRASLQRHAIAFTTSLRTHYILGFILMLITFAWGAFVAGYDAGLACADFPKTCFQWVPKELFFENRFWRNIVAEPTALQFTHRVLGTVTLIALLSLGIRLIRTRVAPLKKIGLSLHLMILVQWLLGIATIHSQVATPIAAAHQLGAVLTLMMMVTIPLYRLKHPQA